MRGQVNEDVTSYLTSSTLALTCVTISPNTSRPRFTPGHRSELPCSAPDVQTEDSRCEDVGFTGYKLAHCKAGLEQMSEAVPLMYL